MASDNRYADFRNESRFGSLDGLRCVSILAVLWHHAGGWRFASGVLSHGFWGVEVFFAISGFLITTLLLRERDRYQNISLKLFYLRRSLRIFPLYYGVLLVYVALVYLFQRQQPAGQEFFHNLRYFATYTSNWFVSRNLRVIFYFAWSLACEEQFYFFWPSVEKFAPGPYTAVAVLTGIVTVHLLSVGGVFSSSILPSGSFAGIVIGEIPSSLCLGVLLAHGLHSKKVFRLLSPVLYPRWASTVWAALLLGLAAGGSVGNTAIDELLASATMAALAGACVVREDHALALLLRLRPVVWVGRVSYGMYLLHMLCLNVIEKIAAKLGIHSSVALFGGTTLAAFLVAYASFRWYESIFLRWKRHFERSSIARGGGPGSPLRREE